MNLYELRHCDWNATILCCLIFCLFYHKFLIYQINAFYCLFISFASVHIFEHKYHCSFLLLNLGLHSHMFVLNSRKNWKHGYQSLISEKEGGSGFYDNQILSYCLSLGGPLRGAKEVVHILIACVLLLSAPDCLNTDNEILNFRKIFKARGEGKYWTNQL